MDELYTTGNRELDEFIGGLQPYTMLLIVGHPGAGKTTLASQICYANALKGRRCLYLSFYEDKEKLFRNMSKLGINLSEVEAKDFMEFVRLPVASTDEILRILSTIVSRKSYEVMVIDSINPTLDLIVKKEEQRAILLNFFYQLLNIVNGVLVVVAEIPLGKESLELGSIEFVADAIIYLKHRIEFGMLSRIMEVRKVRGAPLTIAEIPFSLNEGEGLKVYIPPKIERVLPSGQKPLNINISFIIESIESIQYGDVVVISYPSIGRPSFIYLPLIDLAVANNEKVLLISYKYSPDELKDVLLQSMQSLGVSRDLVLKVINKYFHLESINPASHSLQLLRSYQIELIDEIKAGIVVFHAVDVFRETAFKPGEYWASFINELNWVKNKGKLLTLYYARIDPRWTKRYESLSDIAIRLHYKRRDTKLIPVLYIWKRETLPKIIELGEKEIERLKDDANRIAEIIKARLEDDNV